MEIPAAEALLLTRAGRLSDLLIGVAVLALFVFLLKLFGAREMHCFGVKISTRDFPVVLLTATGLHGLLAWSFDAALKAAAGLPAGERRALLRQLTQGGPTLFDGLFGRIGTVASFGGLRFVLLDALNPLNWLFYALVLCLFASVVFWREAAIDTRGMTILFSLSLLLFNWVLASAWILRAAQTLNAT